MNYLFVCVVFGIASISAKHCDKKCTSDDDCGSDMACFTDDMACDFWCARDLPPPVIGKRGTGCNQLPMMCPQQCMVTQGGCTVCDCSRRTGIKLEFLSSAVFQNFLFKVGASLNNPSLAGQSGKNNPANMHQLFGGSFVPNNSMFPRPTGSLIPQTQNGGSKGKNLYQILMSTVRSPATTLKPTATIRTCTTLRCIAPCNKGVSIGPDLCPICLCK